MMINASQATPLDAGGTALTRARATSQARLVPDDPVDIARHLDVVLRDTTRRMRHQRESHRPPTDIDVGVMILGFGVLSHPAYGVDTGKECRKLDRSAQRAVGALPAVELGQGGVDLLIR
jgi:hypothetical protein